MNRPVTVICDFDGTITTTDVGHSLCSHFAPGVLQQVDALWLSGRIAFHEAFRRACLALRAPEEELVAHALEVGRIRAGFPRLIAACAARQVPLVVSSAGLDLYIDPILARDLGEDRQHLTMQVNRGRVTPRGVEVEYPHRDDGCEECGNCKGARARRERAAGAVVVAVGDSVSDRCLVREADHVFARDWLAAHCRKEGLPHVEFEDFEPVTELVLRLTGGD